MTTESNTVGVYIASKTFYAPKWRALRYAGVPIISTWIDEAGKEKKVNLSDLWLRSIEEVVNCSMLLLYAEEGDALKGAIAEAGIALAHGKPVHYVGPRDLLGMLHHPGVRHFVCIKDALAAHDIHVKEIADIDNQSMIIAPHAWQYRCFEVSTDDRAIGWQTRASEHATSIGSKGWELVSVVSGQSGYTNVLWFKRRSAP